MNSIQIKITLTPENVGVIYKKEGELGHT